MLFGGGLWLLVFAPPPLLFSRRGFVGWYIRRFLITLVFRLDEAASGRASHHVNMRAGRIFTDFDTLLESVFQLLHMGND